MKKFLWGIAIIVIAVIALTALGEDVNKIERSEGNGTQGNSENSSVLYHYELDVKEYGVIAEENGRNLIAIKYGFKNNDDDAHSFYSGITHSVFQNGVKLKVAHDYERENEETYIKSGASVDVVIVYELIDTTSDVEVELELGGTTMYYHEDVDKKITRIIKISGQ